MKKIAALLTLLSGVVVALPGRADSVDAPRHWVPATDAELSGVNQAFSTPKMHSTPPFGGKATISPDSASRSTVGRSLSPKVVTAPDELHPPQSEPRLAQEVSRPPVFEADTTKQRRTQPGDDIKAVEKVIARWSKAWSEQNVPTYLSQYSPDFRPSDASSRPTWTNQRKSRLVRPKFIELTLQDVRVDLVDSGLMQVRFRQSYQSDLYSDSVGKQLELEKTVEGWRILRETVVP